MHATSQIHHVHITGTQTAPLRPEHCQNKNDLVAKQWKSLIKNQSTII